MRVNSENEEKASVSSAGFAAQRAVSTLVISALFFVNDGNMHFSIAFFFPFFFLRGQSIG